MTPRARLSVLLSALVVVAAPTACGEASTAAPTPPARHGSGEISSSRRSPGE